MVSCSWLIRMFLLEYLMYWFGRLNMRRNKIISIVIANGAFTRAIFHWVSVFLYVKKNIFPEIFSLVDYCIAFNSHLLCRSIENSSIFIIESDPLMAIELWNELRNLFQFNLAGIYLGVLLIASSFLLE